MSYHHVCTTADCPLIGQRTDRFCTCHKTPEQMMQAEIDTLRERRDDLLRANNAFEARAREAERAAKAMTTLRPASEYHEDMGDVLWWKLPITEPPYVGSPNDLGFEVIVEPTLHIWTSESDESSKDDPSHTSHPHRFHVGGWPGYHTHFSPLPMVRLP